MNLVEFEAKALLRRAGLPLPAGVVADESAATVIHAPCVLKAQVAEGGRGRRGLVLPVAVGEDGASRLGLLRERMRAQGHDAPWVLVEESIEVAQECYFSWSIDDVAQDYVLQFSMHGGIEVESQAHTLRSLHFAPCHVPAAHEFVHFFAAAGAQGRTVGALCRFASASWRVFVQEDAQLLEINPLAVLPSGEVMALDAKLVLDDNAAARHLDWPALYSSRLADRQATALERRAAASGFAFVELDGEIAMLAGGAGIGMAILDILADAGMPAANFADASGGSGANVFETLGRITFERAARPDVTAILMYFTLAATSVASVVKGVMALLDAAEPPKPLVIGLLCAGAGEREMTFAQARDAFAARGLRCEPGLPEALDALAQVRLARGADPHPIHEQDGGIR
ncbi:MULTISPECIES: ATP-grasp domain-containing protein [unclassified Variovorax]|uniref:ATP-grasp domain-containing protein n=1 Tax=unclassified Variovorax TaxID=663243 RepID=UPI00076BF3A5|nr:MULTISPECIES: ATP-grasp domain-containing protein [unclassified Variovorax]KWT73932.1 Succinyl-CoA ligase [ADP-forming] beta chain [Variovorax sp. WDL1]PNG52269.1 Succinyl-CoA ligase [ADP-forming] subunit beta [Variovorax sp. B4]PNG54809.1 Succinyl-CoA ligase [ADP-forming] subunit beta [Variovorax sp. B2]VTV15812.1 Succinyl-CoA ligase [ADP-forming] subunit beta [Variovorax sp. WDL1]